MSVEEHLDSSLLQLMQCSYIPFGRVTDHPYHAHILFSAVQILHCRHVCAHSAEQSGT
jgi:hypothetical protein